MRGNPCAARSLTVGEKSSLPLNHGLTVCWSVDTTSMMWPAIRERMWLETISRVNCCWAEGRVSVRVRSNATQAVAMPLVEAVNQFQFQKSQRDFLVNCEYNSTFTFRRRSFGAVKYSASCFSAFFNACVLRHSSAHAGQSWICFSSSKIAAG